MTLLLGMDATSGSTYSVLSVMPSDSESSSSLSSVGTTGKASSPLPLPADQQVNEKVENLSIQLQLMTRERNELRKRLAFATHGATFDKRPYRRLNPDYERLKIQCVRAMSDLQSLQNQHTNALKRCEEVAKETDFYHTLHSRLLSDQTQLKDDVDMLRRENGQLLRERNLLQQSWEDMKRLHEEDQKEIGDLRAQQQQVLKHNGSSEILNKLYDTAMDKLEVVKKDYDALRKRYSEKVAMHNSDLSRLEQLTEENQRLLKQTEMLTQQRDTAIQLQHQCALSLRRFEAIHYELNKATAQNKDLQWEMELLQSELTELRTMQVRTAQESEKYREERDAVFSEYRLIMSERDQVISELDKLQTEVELAESKLKNSTSEKKAANEEMETLRQIKDTMTVDAGRANKEVEILRKQCKALCQELKEALQETDVAKCRRDWAFQERDKIVAERDSIRTLCDNLRRERDRAVSELAEALRSLDDTRKQKNDVSRELKELKEQMESQLEKEARFRQLMAHSSHDSAIDTDSMEWETEVVEFERETEDIDLKALGFDMAEGVNEPCFPGDCGIFVTKVDKGSIADGRLRVNDWLLRINDVDLINKDKKQAIRALLNGEGAINMVVRRRKSLGGKVVTPLHINLSGHKDSGISLETGVYAAAVAPGSPAAKEGTLAVGDRIVAINGIALDNKSLNECESLLRSCQDSLTLSLLKVFPQSASWSGQNIFENIKDSDKLVSFRTHGPEVQAHNKRNLMQHNNSTQTDIFYEDHPEDRRELGPPRGSSSFLHKPFLGDPFPAPPQTCPSTSERSLSSFRSDNSGERGYGLVDVRSRQPLPSFETEGAPCGAVEAPLDKADSEGSNSGGTWPKAVPGSVAGPEKLSPSKRVGPLTPPKPPKRSDSIKFQHRLETSSESEATLVGSSPSTSPPIALPPRLDPGEPMHASPPRKARVRIASSYYPEGDGDTSCLPAKKSCDEDLTSQKVDELGQKRRRPKSAPSCRPKVAPVVIPAQFLEEHKCVPASGELSPEAQEWSPHSPGHSSRQGNSPFYPNRPSVGTVPRNVTPSTTVSSILRNPIYTVRSHRVGPCSSPPVPRDVGPQNLPPSVQHQGRLSLDLSHRACGDCSDMRASHGSNSLPSSARLGSSSNLQFKAERIKIPLTPRYPRSVMGSDRGSLSHSECSTPPQSPLNIDTLPSCSQPQTSASTLPRIAINATSHGERRKDRPYLEEPRHVKVQKGSEPLGISIVSGEKGGIYVSKVTPGSIAHQAGLEYGDQLLEFNGINLRSATEQQARLIIGQQCDTITILTQYNPHMHQLSSHSRSSSHLDPAGAHSTNQGSGATTPEHPSVIDPLMEQDEGPGSPPAKQSTPSSRQSQVITQLGPELWPPVAVLSRGRTVGDTNKKTSEPRVVFIKKSQVELGVHLCGGNLHGVFVAEVEDDSLAKGPDGLMPGDLILEYGNLDMRNKTVEEVYVEMLKPKDVIRLKVQHRPEDFARIKGLPGDGFYIRALYDRQGEVEHDLNFKKDDILYVDNTLPQGTFGCWMAWQLDESAHKMQRGQIPSKYVMDQEFSRRLSMSEVKDDGNTAKTLSAAARRSFFRRKHRHKRSGSKDGKDLLALDTFSNDPIPLLEGKCQATSLWALWEGSLKLHNWGPNKRKDYSAVVHQTGGGCPGCRYGNLDMRNKTVEEVYVEMLKPKDVIRLKVQHRPEDFARIKGLPGDGFYIRALYDRQGEVEHDLNFKKDDILYVDNTLPQGTFGCWMAWQLDESAHKMQRGQIPSKYVMDQEFSRRLSMSEVKDDGNTAKTLSAAARRSFFRRKHRHKRSGSKDGKDLLALDTFSNDPIPLLEGKCQATSLWALWEDSMSLAYQRVQKADCTSLRPVLILGPLLDVVKEMLVNEAPGKFCRCPLEVMKASQQAIERGVKDCLFVDYKRRSGHFDVTTVASIKEITEKNRHCLLDIAPHAIERLHHMHIYPIVIFIHYKSAKQIKEQRDPVYLRDKVTQRHSKEQFETAQKIEQEYSKYFTAVVQGGPLSSICTQILAVVNQEQSKALWIPAGPI
ncbi:Disks large-like protein 5 [Heterocephalus glaber]|uniref:Disks large-like protein 5 n=1 Tax=Heterocephalus glaber TaxID=10181 RepID=G5BRJ8_HETGA|nr:Disks large-like protein 5 [Heterocephalus glaber]